MMAGLDFALSMYVCCAVDGWGFGTYIWWLLVGFCVV